MQRITSPQEFFGHQMGADRKIARWDKIVEYFYQLEQQSDRMRVINMGPSTEGHPFLLAIITAPANLARLEHYREINRQITDPRGLTEEQVKLLVKEGKSVIVQSMSLHASEIGGTQMAPELAYDLLSSDDPDNQRILDEVIFLMVPCFNPDGQHMVTDWYNQWLDSEYEGASLPWLYHKYAGHDNNRDAFMLNLVESQYMAKIMFEDWHPQAFQDHHHMGSYGPRLYVSPYSEPIRPDADPLIWRELSWYGAHMAYKLEEAGKTGIANGVQFPGWGHFGFHWMTNHHNIAGMLTESASAKLATPLYIQPSQLTGADKRTLPEYAPQTNFPNPWPGGWWRLRDIVEQQKIAAWALLDLVARHRETVLWNAYQKAKRQTERGLSGKTYAYLIAPEQHDPLTARKLVQVLLRQGVEVQVAKAPFQVEGRTYPAGTYVVFLAQPKMGLLKALLGRTLYPDNMWTRLPDGTPTVFDAATDTVAEYMGVEMLPVEKRFKGEFAVVRELPRFEAAIASGEHGYVFDGRLNDSFRAVNRLQVKQVKVRRVRQALCLGDICLPAGAFYVEPSAGQHLPDLAAELGVTFHALESPLVADTQELRPLRTGVYQRYYGGNTDEGWTRLTLEKFDFPYTTVMDADIKAGNLFEKYDVLLFPNDWKQLVVDVTKPDKDNPRAAMMLRWFGDTIPPEYKSGIGQEGVNAIKDFVKAGGRLVAMNAACDLAIDILSLKVRNVLAGLDAKSFLTQGSTLRVEVDINHPYGYGMPDHALALHWNSPAFQVTDTFHAENYDIVASYQGEDLLQSGRLVGEEKIAGKAAVIAVRHGQGQVVLLGFPPQHRGQTHGTFKLLFNSIV